MVGPLNVYAPYPSTNIRAGLTNIAFDKCSSLLCRNINGEGKMLYSLCYRPICSLPVEALPPRFKASTGSERIGTYHKLYNIFSSPLMFRNNNPEHLSAVISFLAKFNICVKGKEPQGEMAVKYCY